MIIETFIDAQDLTNNQSLVIIDEQGRRWDVEEALNKSPSSSPGGKGQMTRPEVIVERWVVQLGEASEAVPLDLGIILPRVYKNAVVLFRSIYAYSRLLPAWKFGKRLFKGGSSPKSPKLKYRIIEGPHVESNAQNDHLVVPLFDSRESALEKFVFESIDSPAGSLSLRVTYRTQCDFRIDDSEAFLSSRFMGIDGEYFEPSLGRRQDKAHHQRDHPRPATEAAGSLPPNRNDSPGHPAQGQAYGSMSTFHQVGPPAGTSPLSALRAARIAGSESPEDMVPKKAPPNTRSAQGSRSSLRSADGVSGVGRRPSVSFMPFKSPSLSASPSQAEQLVTSAGRGSLGKPSPLAALAEARTPSTRGPRGLVPSRGSPNAPDQAIPSSVSSSPKPGPPQRFSSSFGHRKAKLSTGGSSRTEDENSSGKASITSFNAQPSSGILAEGGGGSSGSIQTDDDNISDFLKLLDQKKDLKSFRNTNDKTVTEASTRRTSAALNKFQRMRDANDALSTSMSSSLLLQRSSTSSSRRLSSLPPMVAGTSTSPSSSFGKPVSPHTPQYTPAIPSRLSANSIIEYPRRDPSRADDRRPRSSAADGAQHSSGSRDPSTGAIDIPNSPRPFHPNYRRSSSAAQQARNMPYEDDEIFPFGLRSASVGVDDRPLPSLSALAGLHEDDPRDESAVAVPSVEDRGPDFGPMFDPSDRSSLPSNREEAGSYPARGAPYRPRIGRGSGRGTPPQGSSSSLAERGSASGGSSDHRGGRFSFTRPPSTFEDEEPLLFAMSDFSTNQPSRRSLEDNRGGSSGGHQERGPSDSGASCRGGSRRSGY